MRVDVADAVQVLGRDEPQLVVPPSSGPSMTGAGDYLTGGAAFLAALLSALSLLLTRRWQRAQHEEEVRSRTKAWVLENFRTALVDHINLSFQLGRACRDGVVAKRSGDGEALGRALDRATQLHVGSMDLMIYLRLFGSASIVRAAERLHSSLDNLVDLTFVDEIERRGSRSFTYQDTFPPGLTEATARGACMDHREALINEVREYLGLPKDAIINRAV